MIFLVGGCIMSMDYCKWENLRTDIRSCYRQLNDALDSNTEIEARKEVLEYCQLMIDEAKEIEEEVDIPDEDLR